MPRDRGKSTGVTTAAVGRVGRFKTAVVVLAVVATALAASSSGTARAASRTRAAGTSAPGVTRSTVTVGQIADISEPVPGLFKSAQVGVQAYFDYINSKGGVNGRKLILDSHDSAFQPADVATAAQQIAKNELAFVGNYTLLDSSAKTVIDADHVPNIGTPIGEALANDPNTYNPSPSGDYVADLGPFQYFKQKDRKATQHVGILYAAATPSTIQAYQVLRKVLAHLGYKVVYARGFSAFETTFTADVVKMKSAGVRFFWADVPSNYSAVLAREMALQNFKPISYQTAGYGTNLTQLGGGAVNGTYLPLFTALFLGQDAKTTPIVGTFDKWMAKVDSKDSIASWGAAGWASADLFVQALRKAGRNPTRASLVAALDKITSFNAHGLIPTSNPAQNIPSPCWLLAQVKGRSIVRVPPSPKSGFICKPGGQFDLPGYAPLKRG